MVYGNEPLMSTPPEAVGEAVFCGALVLPPPLVITTAFAALQVMVPVITALVAPERTNSTSVEPDTGKASLVPATVIVWLGAGEAGFPRSATPLTP